MSSKILKREEASMPDTVQSEYDQRFLAGLRYHYLGRYWDSHFILEKLWLDSEGATRQVAQVLIMAGAAWLPWIGDGRFPGDPFGAGAGAHPHGQAGAAAGNR